MRTTNNLSKNVFKDDYENTDLTNQTHEIDIPEKRGARKEIDLGSS